MGFFERFLSLWVALAVIVGVTFGASAQEQLQPSQASSGGSRCPNHLQNAPAPLELGQ